MSDREAKAAAKAPQLAGQIGEVIHSSLALMAKNRGGEVFQSDDEFDFYLGVVTGFTDIVTQSANLSTGGSFQSSLIYHIFAELSQEAAEQSANTVFSYMQARDRPASFDRGLECGTRAGNAFVVDQDPGEARSKIMNGLEKGQ